MGINDLKAKAYQMAGVSTTQQLKDQYGAIAHLNLRLKASWEEAIAFLETNPPGDRPSHKTLAALKAEVYALAQVSTPRQLKAQHTVLQPLNFSFKASWEQALALLTTPPQDVQSWLANPPEAYRDLFAEIESVSNAFDAKLRKAQGLAQEAQVMSKDLAHLATAAELESDQLRQEAELAYQMAQQAKLN